VFEKFQLYKAMVQNQTNIKVLQNENVGEYRLNEFNFFCQENAIRKKFTIIYTP
jgi:hypothetical protein